MWDPDVYLAFSGHRNRPFYELVSRVGLERARRVVDLGCGPGPGLETKARHRCGGEQRCVALGA